MRRKTSPSPLAPRTVDRPLRPARGASLSFLPTAASIAVALAAIGCSTPTLDVIAADPVTSKAATAPPPAASSAAPTPYIEPDPHDIDGDIAVVEPTPVKPVSSAKKK